MKVNDIGKVKSNIEQKLDLLPVVKETPARWELDKSRGWICCTRCHNEMPLRYTPGGTLHKEDFQSPYCPYCGTKMENGVDI